MTWARVGARAAAAPLAFALRRTELPPTAIFPLTPQRTYKVPSAQHSVRQSPLRYAQDAGVMDLGEDEGGLGGLWSSCWPGWVGYSGDGVFPQGRVTLGARLFCSNCPETATSVAVWGRILLWKAGYPGEIGLSVARRRWHCGIGGAQNGGLSLSDVRSCPLRPSSR